MADDRSSGVGRGLLQVFGGAAIAVALLLPLVVLNQRATDLAIARLEFQLARATAAARSGETASVPADHAAAGASMPATIAPPAASRGPRSSAPTPARVEPPDKNEELTTAIAELTRKVDDLVMRGIPVAARSDDSTTTVPTGAAETLAAAEGGDTPAETQNALDTRVRVQYQSRCMAVAVAVAERLISMGMNPELVDGGRRRLLAARATYASSDLRPTATRVAEALRDVTPVEVVLDTKSPVSDRVLLQLAAGGNCGRR